ncbi:DHHW family protein [Acetatifactor aquisgranensis]|uniref:DHHW family protein n=1 Tax=Acetatifactor aquisgranensis TaxID=2941233 RepID=UPI002041309D|nr:DHHW family protein [Acetatifactor aquisgranensis]MCI8543751.1 hypothetical protein [Lachnospiraceae bacterium]
MDEKRSALFTIIVITSVIAVFGVADLIQRDRLFSETENRVLAGRPEFTLDAFLREGYAQKYEAYLSDQFVSRDKWITIKTYMDLLLQEKEVGGVYLGSDGYLIERHLPEEYSHVQEAKRIALLEKLVWEWDAGVMLVPTADNILSDKLPKYAPYYDQKQFLEQVAQHVGPEHYVDVYSVLREHAGEEIYYRTDHHWTSLGAGYGYDAWAQYTGRRGGRYTAEDMELVAEDFLGTLQRKVNLNMAGDDIYYFPETLKRPLKVTYDLKEEAETCYEASHLDTKNKYGFFLDDNHAFVEIETEYHNHKSLFIIKDSYANCFVPLLIPHYEKIYVLDLRYFRGRLFEFMEEHEPKQGMDVLVLYNCIHFLEEFSYVE